MHFFIRKNKDNLIFLLCIITIISFIKWILPICWPLVVALILVAPMYDILWKLEFRTHIKCGLLTGFFVVMGIGLMAIAVILVCLALFHIIVEQIGELGTFEKQYNICMGKFCVGIASLTKLDINHVTNFVHTQTRECQIWIQETCLPNLLQKSVNSFRIFFTSSAVIFITGIMVVLLSKEYPAWRQFFYKQEMAGPLGRISLRMKQMVKAYVRAEGIIFIMILTIVTIGMFLVKSKHPFFYGVIAAILDFLPFIGTGIVLVPNALYRILLGDYVGAVILFAIYGTSALLREILEPKLLGNKMKISPVLVLLSVFAGIKIYGIVGVISGPITLILIIECYKEIIEK